MNTENKYIVVTGGAGFIGSNVVQALNEKSLHNIIIVDHLNNEKKQKNLDKLTYKTYYDRDEFLKLLESNSLPPIKTIIHLGACSNTMEPDKKFLIENNTQYTEKLFHFSIKNGIKFIYASSAATYGNGSKGYNDETLELEPLNYYGESKYLFDRWILDQKEKPSQWVGLKFFNVYGPNEYHKGRMASVIFHGYYQIKEKGELSLFKSYKAGFKDGEQKRDFIYVKDVVKVIFFFMENPHLNGIFNVGTGKARTFYDLGIAIFKALEIDPKITFIDMPESLKEKYQYFTEADMTTLQKAGYKEKFYELEEGVADYVKNYLAQEK